jgi:2-hydroxy-6-oxonona-2,4-dienedioate hydrolase
MGQRSSDRAPLRRRQIEVRGARLHMYAGGDGPPVVLVHGFAVSSVYMLPLARALASSHFVHTVDLPGHGRSGTLSRSASIESFSDALGDWVDVVGLERPTFVANSMGCQVVTDLAVRRPACVGPLVLIGPSVDPHRRSARHQLMSAVRDLGHEPISLLARTAGEEVRAARISTLVPLVRSAIADRIEDRLPMIEQPTVIVRGSEDGFAGADWVQHAVDLLPHGRLVVVEGEAHAVHYTRPHLVARIVREFVGGEHEGGWVVGEPVERRNRAG